MNFQMLLIDDSRYGWNEYECQGSATSAVATFDAIRVVKVRRSFLPTQVLRHQ